MRVAVALSALCIVIVGGCPDGTGGSSVEPNSVVQTPAGRNGQQKPAGFQPGSELQAGVYIGQYAVECKCVNGATGTYQYEYDLRLELTDDGRVLLDEVPIGAGAAWANAGSEFTVERLGVGPTTLMIQCVFTREDGATGTQALLFTKVDERRLQLDHVITSWPRDGGMCTGADRTTVER
ncbi:MAG: hypothetical protein AB1716_12085 [Planctomycetota bacterium]